MKQQTTYGSLVFFIALILFFQSCDLIKRKKDEINNGIQRKAIARVTNTLLYEDELKGIVPEKTTKDDSAARINAYC